MERLPGASSGTQAALTRVPLGAVQALLRSRLHRPASLHKKLLSQGVAEPTQRVRDGTPLRAAQALSLAQKVALGKGEAKTENSIQGERHTTEDKGHTVITAHIVIAGHTNCSASRCPELRQRQLADLPTVLLAGVTGEETTHR